MTDDRWFGTHRHGSVVQSSAWAIGQNLSRAVFQILSAVVLSRLIAPEQFGVFAVMLALHGLVTPLFGNAFSSALIQKRDLSEQEASNFFWTAAAAAGLCAAAFAAAGPAIAAIFGDPVYRNLTVAFAALVWLDTIGAQYQAIVMRSLRFDTLFRIQLATMPLALAAGVVAALAGLGTWALVIHMAVSSGLLRVLLIRATGWRPRRFRRAGGLREMVKFGAMMSLGALTRLAYDRLPMLFLANAAGPAAAGFFNRGDALFKGPFEQAVHPIAVLLLPTMSAAAQDPPQLQRLVTQSVWLLTVAMAPLIAAMAVFGDWVAIVLLGPPWAEAGEVVRWMAVMAIGTTFRRPLAATNAALDRPARAVWLKLALLPAFLGLMLWAAPQGASAAAMAMAIFYMGMLPLEMVALLRGLPLRRRAILTTCAAALAFTATLGAAMIGLRAALPGLVDPTAPRLSDVLDIVILFLGAYLIVLPLAALFPEARALLRHAAGKVLTRLPGRASRRKPATGDSQPAANGAPT